MNTGMPWSISLLVMAVIESELTGSMTMQSISPAASLASIWLTCWLASFWTGAIDAHSIG